MSELEIAFWILFAAHIYIAVGLAYLFFKFIPWMWEDALEAEIPPSVYKALAVETVYWWPPLAISDIMVFFEVRKANKERERRLQDKGL